MCKTKMATNAANPTSSPRPSRNPASRSNSQPSTQAQTPRTSTPKPTAPSRFSPTATATATATTTSYSDPTTSSSYGSFSTTGYRLSSDNSISSRTSLTHLRDTLPENPNIYDFSEICVATNNFLAKRYSSSSSTPSWRCTLRGADVIVFQRKFRRKLETSQLRERLSLICRSHIVSIIKLLGASISGDHIYLVYEFVHGANLSDCLRNKINTHFTVLSTWLSRMQVATDVAHGLDYVHNKTGLSITFVHNHIKSSAIVITEPNFNARVCHFGAAQLCGEIQEEESDVAAAKLGEIEEEPLASPSPARSEKLKRSGGSGMQFEGVRGYMSPEFQATGVATQKSDVYAFGVVMLELLSGEEPLRFRYDKKSGEFVRTSVIDAARAAVDGGEGALRRWVDKRLKDSFPVEVAEKVTRVALDCVHVDPDKRPKMGRVADKISKLYLESKIWSENVRMPTEISVSLAPR